MCLAADKIMGLFFHCHVLSMLASCALIIWAHSLCTVDEAGGCKNAVRMLVLLLFLVCTAVTLLFSLLLWVHRIPAKLCWCNPTVTGIKDRSIMEPGCMICILRDSAWFIGWFTNAYSSSNYCSKQWWLYVWMNHHKSKSMNRSFILSHIIAPQFFSMLSFIHSYASHQALNM